MGSATHKHTHTHTKTQALIRRELHVRISAVASLERHLPHSQRTYMWSKHTRMPHKGPSVESVTYRPFFTCWLLIISLSKQIWKDKLFARAAQLPLFPHRRFYVQTSPLCSLSVRNVFDSYGNAAKREKQVYGFPAIQTERDPFHNKR